MRCTHRGFTLVELVSVIVILGIIGLGTTAFIRYAVDTYQLAQSRSQVINDSRFVVERLGRELREALPGSIRTSECQNGDCACVEFTPTRYTGRYLWSSRTLSIILSVLPWADDLAAIQSADIARLAIKVQRPEQIYQSVHTGDSRWVTLGASTLYAMNLTTPCDLATEDCLVRWDTHQQPPALTSPGNRYYLVTKPVSYCAVNNQLWRYSDYGFADSSPGPREVVKGGALMADGLQATASDASQVRPFQYASDTFRRTGVLRYQLAFGTSRGETVSFQNEVHLANVP